MAANRIGAADRCPMPEREDSTRKSSRRSRSSSTSRVRLTGECHGRAVVPRFFGVSRRSPIEARLHRVERLPGGIVLTAAPLHASMRRGRAQGTLAAICGDGRACTPPPPRRIATSFPLGEARSRSPRARTADTYRGQLGSFHAMAIVVQLLCGRGPFVCNRPRHGRARRSDSCLLVTRKPLRGRQAPRPAPDDPPAVPRMSAPPRKAFMTQGSIRIRGARQHNLKNLDLDIRTGEMTVVTGPERLGQVQPGVRHAVRRRPAALRRDLLAPTRASSSTAWTSRRSTRSRACRRRSPSTRPTRCAPRARRSAR